jgi:23S rRNA (cytosine1962-C5)-methyltransferase
MDLLALALKRREGLIVQAHTQAFRAFSGAADGLDGVFVDVYGEGATLIVYEGRPPARFMPEQEAQAVLRTLAPLGVKAVYLKPFARDRSRMGGVLPEVVTSPTPAAGEALAESFAVREHGWSLEVRMYDGLSTGLFLDQRDNRAWAHHFAKERISKAGAATPPSVLNTFAYTCAFSVAAAMGGAVTTSVDVSARYLDWGKRNFTLNGLDPAQHRFAKMDTFEFFAYARRKQLTYDLIILDPPSFATGNKKKGIRAWSAVADYSTLVHEAAGLLRPGGTIFASTNTQELCRPGKLEREIEKGLGDEPRWVRLPPVPADFARDRERFVARAFVPKG